MSKNDLFDIFTRIVLTTIFFDFSTAQYVYPQQQMYPVSYSGVCHYGTIASGSCPLGFCVSPAERCSQGTCCRNTGTGYYNGQTYQQCPNGMIQDGTCYYTGVCFDPQERCIQGICCQYNIAYNQCPLGSVKDGTCTYTGICFDPRERCIQGNCCQFNTNSYPIYPTYPNNNPYYPTNPYGCRDLDPSCPYYVAQCANPSVADVCVSSCRLCGALVSGK